jgi:hypothetical protein
VTPDEPFEVREQRLRELAARQGMTLQTVRTNKSGMHLFWIASAPGIVMRLSADARTIAVDAPPGVETDDISVYSCTSLDEAETYLASKRPGSTSG